VFVDTSPHHAAFGDRNVVLKWTPDLGPAG
jgi:hypothetical protein